MKKFFIFILIALCSCKTNRDKSFSYVKFFLANENKFNAMLNLIEDKYINSNTGKDLNRKTILICGEKQPFSSKDYRHCDSLLEISMNELNISVINMEKNKCFDEKNFDLVSFELSFHPGVYIQYSFCKNEIVEKFENNNVKIDPIKDKWVVFIEKN